MKNFLLVGLLGLASVSAHSAANCSSNIGQTNSCCSSATVTARLGNIKANCAEGWTATSCTDTTMGIKCGAGPITIQNYPKLQKAIRSNVAQ